MISAIGCGVIQVRNHRISCAVRFLPYICSIKDKNIPRFEHLLKVSACLSEVNHPTIQIKKGLPVRNLSVIWERMSGLFFNLADNFRVTLWMFNHFNLLGCLLCESCSSYLCLTLNCGVFNTTSKTMTLRWRLTWTILQCLNLEFKATSTSSTG